VHLLFSAPPRPFVNKHWLPYSVRLQVPGIHGCKAAGCRHFSAACAVPARSPRSISTADGQDRWDGQVFCSLLRRLVIFPCEYFREAVQVCIVSKNMSVCLQCIQAYVWDVGMFITCEIMLITLRCRYVYNVYRRTFEMLLPRLPYSYDLGQGQPKIKRNHFVLGGGSANVEWPLNFQC